MLVLEPRRVTGVSRMQWISIELSCAPRVAHPPHPNPLALVTHPTPTPLPL